MRSTNMEVVSPPTQAKIIVLVMVTLLFLKQRPGASLLKPSPVDAKCLTTYELGLRFGKRDSLLLPNLLYQRGSSS